LLVFQCSVFRKKGAGILDFGRIMSRAIPGIIDAAIASRRLVTRSVGKLEIQVTIQNRGTTAITNLWVEMKSRFGAKQFHVPHLAPGAIQMIALPIRLEMLPVATEFDVTSRLTLPPLLHDATLRNNQRTDSFVR
jgi:hypothetical protein